MFKFSLQGIVILTLVAALGGVIFRQQQQLASQQRQMGSFRTQVAELRSELQVVDQKRVARQLMLQKSFARLNKRVEDTPQSRIGLLGLSSALAYREGQLERSIPMQKEAIVPEGRSRISGRISFFSAGNVQVFSGDGQFNRLGKLAAIEFPSGRQPFAEQAEMFARGFCDSAEVTYTVAGKDTGGNDLIHLWVNDVSLNYAMVRAGYAWPTERHFKSLMCAAPRDAQHQNRGLWMDDRAVSPSSWRKLGQRQRDDLSLGVKPSDQ